MKLGHVHLKVKNLDRATHFYTQLLGAQLSERVGDQFVFLSFGEAHHDLALQAVGESAPSPAPGTTGLYHVAFEVESAAQLLASVTKLEELNAPVALVDHQISWAAYSHDPDGNGVEIYLDRRQLAGEESIGMRLVGS